MTGRPKDDDEKAPEPGSKDDLLHDIEPGDPSKIIEEEGEVPGGGNFA